jgi:hypothetical protein
MGKTCSTYIREVRNAFRILVGNLEGKRKLDRLRYRLEDNINPLSRI